MILPDPDAPARLPQPVAPRPGVARSAPPLARLAAVIVDLFIVLGPLFVLVTAPLKRRLTADALTGDEAYVVLLALSIGLTGLVLLIVYQTFCHHLFGRTPGKRVFGLRVEAAPGETTSLGAHLLRSVTWALSALCAGLPFLSVISHPRRRPAHDRVAETRVTSEQGGAGAPTEVERRFARVAFVTTAMFLLGFLGVNVAQVLARLDYDPTVLSEVNLKSECEVVSQSAPEDDADPHGRLRLALTLYAAGLADRSCLEGEVDRETAASTPLSAITYLAQAFVNADDAEVSNAYLDRVCADDAGSAECAMSHVVSAWSEEDWDQVGRTLAAAPRGSGFLEVWGVRHYARQAEYDRELATLDALITRPEVASFSQVQRVKALYGVDHAPEAREAFKAAFPSLNPDEGRELSAWSCVQELGGGCDGLAKVACREALKNETKPGESASNAETMVSLRAAECAADRPVDYQELADAIGDGDWQTFFRGSLKAQRHDRAAAAELFTSLVEGDETPELLRVEATRRLAAVATPAELSELGRRARDFPAREARVHVGQILIGQLARAGRPELARHLAENLSLPTANETSERRPASTDGP